MKPGQCFMLAENAPPGWQWAGDGPVPVDGVEFESGVATRLFQSVDAFPAEWGRLTWRVQLNKIVSGRAVTPVFRTFYPGVEWNLKHPDDRWFLTAWLKWEGPGPPYPDPGVPGPVRIEGETALFRIAWMPKPKPAGLPDAAPEPNFERPIFLRSRVDARDRRQVAESFHEQAKAPKSDPGLILLDDILKASE